MLTPSKTLVDLETRFWQSIVDHDTDAAIELLTEPAVMVTSHGSMKFDHAGYRKMAEQGSMDLISFEFADMQVVFPAESTAILLYRVKQGVRRRGSDKATLQDMNDTSTWIHTDGRWKCAGHTETPAQAVR